MNVTVVVYRHEGGLEIDVFELEERAYRHCAGLLYEYIDGMPDLSSKAAIEALLAEYRYEEAVKMFNFEWQRAPEPPRERIELHTRKLR
jgi:hypothetical protein